MADVTVVKPDPLLPQYRWNPNARHGLGAHIDENGRFVSRATIRGELDKVLKGLSGESDVLTDSLREGKIDLASWQTGMMKLTKQSALVGAVMQKGSWYNMTQSDFGRVGAMVKEQYKFLREYAKGIENGTRSIHKGVSRQYIQFGRQAFYVFEVRDIVAAGFDERRCVLHARESCVGSGSCIEQASYGWLPIDDDRWLEVGRRICRGNCLCTWEYRNSATGDMVSA